jgi:hypothetical protein
MITSIPQTKDRHRRRTTVYCLHISHSARPPSRFPFTHRVEASASGLAVSKTRRGLGSPGLAVVVSARKRGICSHITAQTSASQMAPMSPRRSVGVACWPPVLAQRAIIMCSLDARSGRPTGHPPPFEKRSKLGGIICASLDGRSGANTDAIPGERKKRVWKGHLRAVKEDLASPRIKGRMLCRSA